ncbi:valine--tRNA ligase [Patescibacteria group bacterium]
MKNLFSSEFEGPYKASEFEPEILRFWEEKNYSKAENNSKKEKFVISTPPPNVTGELHIGHITPFAFIDIYGRKNRMDGKNVLLVPGTDHAAIAAQNVVEKELKKKGTSKEKLGRKKFTEEMWKFIKEYRPRIEKQIKMVGVSVDWSRNHFTMDPDLTNAVHEAFEKLKKDRLIYQDEYLVNWCPRCGTALSDDEVEHKEQDTKLYTFKYSAEFPISISTTRPETKLGDTAVAVNPKDKRYKKHIGENFDIDFLGVKLNIKIVGDKAVDMKFGTGAVGITPAHSLADWRIAKENNLKIIPVIGQNTRILDGFRRFSEMKIKDARNSIVEQLEEKGILEKVEDIKNNASICYRCESLIEPLPSKQWFVKIESLAKLAREAVKKGEIKIVPKNFEKIYFNWMDNIHDWCISRQLWWGHSVPVWQCQSGIKSKNQNPKIKIEDEYFISIEKPKTCQICKNCKPKQSEDVLDTWFSSALWPFATLGWPKESTDMKDFYPTTMMITGKDILFFWVARMIMFGKYFTGKAPFDTVLIHGLILDKHGKKMSKSKGNVINPLPMIELYGSDALRMAVIVGNTLGNDVALGEDKIRAYRNFSNKIWNATRFVISNLEDFDPSTKPKLDKESTRYLDKLNKIISETDEHFEKKRIALAAEKLYEFFWHYFCDRCIEDSKARINDPATKYMLYTMLASSLKLMHPYIPFVTEACWQKLRENIKNNNLEESIMIAKWPSVEEINKSK